MKTSLLYLFSASEQSHPGLLYKLQRKKMLYKYLSFLIYYIQSIKKTLVEANLERASKCYSKKIFLLSFQVKIWFQNRRTKWKKQNPGLDINSPTVNPSPSCLPLGGLGFGHAGLLYGAAHPYLQGPSSAAAAAALAAAGGFGLLRGPAMGGPFAAPGAGSPPSIPSHGHHIYYPHYSQAV